VAFELASARHSGHTAGEMLDLLEQCGLSVFTLAGWLAGEPPLDRESFVARTRHQLDYCFVAGTWPRGAGE